MNKYYVFMKKDSTQIFKRDESNKLVKMSYNEITVFNNTLKYDFHKEEIITSYEDKYYKKNRYAVLGTDSLCCGINIDLPTKILIYFFDLFENLEINSGEIVIILEEDAAIFFYSNYYDMNKVFDLVFKIVKTKYNLSYKGCLIQDHIITGLQKYLINKYKNGVGYIDDFFLSAAYMTNKRTLCTGRGYWGLDDRKSKNENDEKFYKYLESEGISKKHENIENIKNYVYNEATIRSNIDNINLIIKDEEFNLDLKIINEYVNKTIESNLEELNKLLPDKCSPGTSIKFFMSINNPKTKGKVKEIFQDKTFEIATEEEYNDLVDKVMIYIDYIVKYNTVLYRKKIQQLLNSKRKLEIIHKLNYFENIAYTFDLFISKKELDEMINKLNV